MSLTNSNEVEVIQYLESLAKLEDFYMHKFIESGRHLIHYFDGQGQSWALMEDDDQFVELCIEYLVKYGAPTFVDVEEMKRFEAGKCAG
ncbi:hypothetical protein [Aliikangiella maris]|uniref:Uncharacterized protein n=2 Tax=Aliikangiella maris TaxID=3162458 RepID=A0ABV3MQS8_9GAMM